MNFDTVTQLARDALYSASSQARLNYNENALAQVAFGYSLLALAEAIYNLSATLNKNDKKQGTEE